MGVQAGIDIGSAEVRRIVVETRWGRPRVIEGGGRAPSTVVALPSTALTFRAMAFPFHDRARLETLVRQELEHSLAFPLADSVWDFVARPPRPELEENVFAGACPAARLRETVVRAEPSTVVDGEPYAYQRILASAGCPDGLVVDFGARRTVFCRVRSGHLDYVRALMRGGDELTGALATGRGLSEVAAEALKREKGLELREVRDFLQGLLGDAMLPEESPDVPLYVAGGGSAAPGLLPWLQERLGRPVQFVPLPAGLSPQRDAVAFGMALWGIRGSEGLNLVATLQGERQPVATAAIWLGLILMLITVGVGARAWSAARKLAAYDAAVLAVVRKADPASAVGPLPVHRLQARVDELQGGRNGGRRLVPLLLMVADALKVAAGGPGAEGSPNPGAAASGAPVEGSPSPSLVPQPAASAGPSALPGGEGGGDAENSPIIVSELTMSENELIMQGEARSFAYVTAFKAALSERLQEEVQIPSQGPVGDDRISFTVRVVLQQ